MSRQASWLKLHLPHPVGHLLDRVRHVPHAVDVDRDYFLAHPETRWRVRPITAAELRANELVLLLTDDTLHPGCPTCARYVLVIGSPSGRTRLRCLFNGKRCLFNGNPILQPEQILPEIAALLEARTDDEFRDALLPQVQAIGQPRAKRS